MYVKNAHLMHLLCVAHHSGKVFGIFCQELEFTEQCLVDDPKNYHSWAHRQAVVERWGLFEEEMLFTKQMIEDDVRNNSAWNQRFFIISQISQYASGLCVQRHILYTQLHAHISMPVKHNAVTVAIYAHVCPYHFTSRDMRQLS